MHCIPLRQKVFNCDYEWSTQRRQSKMNLKASQGQDVKFLEHYIIFPEDLVFRVFHVVPHKHQ